MAKRRKTYPREFKIDAVNLVLQGDRSLKDVAKSLGIHPSVLGRWKSQLLVDGSAAFPGKGRQTPEQEELRRLRRELARARQDLEILKKAAAYFAKHSD